MITKTRKVKIVIEAVADTREEALAWAMRAMSHATKNPTVNGQRISDTLPSMYAPAAWGTYRVQPFKPRGGKSVAVA